MRDEIGLSAPGSLCRTGGSPVMSLAIPNTKAGIVMAVAWLQEQCGRAEIPDVLWDAMRLCIEETLTNIVSYADADGSGVEIEIRLSSEGDVHRLEVVDTGVAFDPLGVELDDPVEDLDSLCPGGQGIHLIRNFSTDCAYARVGATNQLTLSFTPETE
ncbi:MAG: ATP-binding protein [Pseudomonadota bacterium]